MSTGTVKWFNSNRGYGFIQPHGGGNDVFVHHSDIVKTSVFGVVTLDEGQQVEMEVEAGKYGLRARNVVPK